MAFREMTVLDCFTGKVKILKRRPRKLFVEIVDVSMCYPGQLQAMPGEKYWINKDEIHKKSGLKSFFRRQKTHNLRKDLKKSPF